MKTTKRMNIFLRVIMYVAISLALSIFAPRLAISEDSVHDIHEEGHENYNHIAFFLGNAHHKDENGFSSLLFPCFIFSRFDYRCTVDQLGGSVVKNGIDYRVSAEVLVSNPLVVSSVTVCKCVNGQFVAQSGSSTSISIGFGNGVNAANVYFRVDYSPAYIPV